MKAYDKANAYNTASINGEIVAGGYHYTFIKSSVEEFLNTMRDMDLTGGDKVSYPNGPFFVQYDTKDLGTQQSQWTLQGVVNFATKAEDGYYNYTSSLESWAQKMEQAIKAALDGRKSKVSAQDAAEELLDVKQALKLLHAAPLTDVLEEATLRSAKRLAKGPAVGGKKAPRSAGRKTGDPEKVLARIEKKQVIMNRLDSRDYNTLTERQQRKLDKTAAQIEKLVQKYKDLGGNPKRLKGHAALVA